MQELDTVEHYEQRFKVVTAILKGETNPTEIARNLGMKRTEVLDYIEEWKDIARNDTDIKNAAKACLTEMSVHYDLIIQKQWEIVEDSDVDLKTKAGTLKQIADVVSKRQETLQRAGLYDDAELADELVDTQEKVEKIKTFLSEFAARHPEFRGEILEGLRNIWNQPVVISNSPALEG